MNEIRHFPLYDLKMRSAYRGMRIGRQLVKAGLSYAKGQDYVGI